MEIIFLKNFEAFAHCLLASEVAVENSDAILVLHIFRVKPVAISSLDASRNFFLKNKFIYVFIYLWLHWVFVAVWAFSSCSKWGLLFVAVHGLLIVVASLVAEHGL